MTEYTDFFSDRQESAITINQVGRIDWLYPCKVCFCVVPTEYTENHIKYHVKEKVILEDNDYNDEVIGWFSTKHRDGWSPAFYPGVHGYVMDEGYIHVVTEYFSTKEECDEFIKEYILTKVRFIEDDLLNKR